ncbi:MAG: restriction endonuclease subunit S [Bacteroidales bacterium]|nr:restriction endonuclease subunit S [Bacteroidales bacterium]
MNKQNWTYKKLGEVCTIERGGSPRPINEYITDDPNGLNWIKIGDAKEGSKYITSTKEKIKPEGLKKTRFVHKGDFILSNSMSFGKPYILEIDGCIHDGWLVIHDDNNTFDKSFLYYLLGSPNMYMEFQRLAVGGVVNNLNSEIVRNVVIPVPPLSTQSRIVSELDLLQSLIDKQKAQLKELDTLAQSIFYDMFGDPVENEKGWEVKKLKYLSSLITNGTTPKGGAEVYVDDGILFLRSQNVWRNRIEFDDIAHIDAKTNAKMYKSVLHHNDILITKTGRINTENSSLGRAALFTGQTGTANINGHVYLIRLLDGVSHIFIIQILTSQAYREYIRKVCVGGIDKRQINKEQVDDFPIILPPLSLQQSYANKIEAIEKQKSAISKSIAETEKLFEYTMDKYFG